MSNEANPRNDSAVVLPKQQDALAFMMSLRRGGSASGDSGHGGDSTDTMPISHDVTMQSDESIAVSALSDLMKSRSPFNSTDSLFLSSSLDAFAASQAANFKSHDLLVRHLLQSDESITARGRVLIDINKSRSSSILAPSYNSLAAGSAASYSDLLKSLLNSSESAQEPGDVDKSICGLPPSDLPPSCASSTVEDPAAKPKAKPKRKRPSLKLEQNEIIGEFTNDDVLLGRGSRSNNHRGNAAFLLEKQRLQPRYLAAASKPEKTKISQELVDLIKRKGGRFLRKSEHGDGWFQVDNLTARKKASQTLREANTSPEDRLAKRLKYSTKG